MKFKFMPTESRSNLTLLHSKEILKFFSRIYLQLSAIFDDNIYSTKINGFLKKKKYIYIYIKRKLTRT